MTWIEQTLGLFLLAATRHVAKGTEFSGAWHRSYGYYVWGCDWPVGLWSAP